MEIDSVKLREWSNEILRACGMLLQHENGSGKRDTQAIRILLNVADELVDLPSLLKAIEDGASISV